ncbi:MAG TPA: A24 family peptidase [Chromatiaceae bacterium]|nr:A24 family peptidase [Chromatiaceae bacterium]
MSALELLIETPALLYATVGLFALAVGSFLNVVIHRLPLMMEQAWRRECAELTGEEVPAAERLSLALPGSRCPHCGHALRARENIPLLSYLFLRGRCSACAQPIGARYPLVEAGTALLSLLVVWHFGVTWEAGAALILTWGLIVLAGIDIDTQLLPDSITLPLLWLGLLLSLAGGFASPRDAILGAALGYLFLWTIYQGFKLITGREGMGYGDFKLFALFGAWLGWQALPMILILSSVVGAVIGLALLARRGQDRHTPLPFGPYLAAAGWLALLWGDSLNGAYLQWSGLG